MPEPSTRPTAVSEAVESDATEGTLDAGDADCSGQRTLRSFAAFDIDAREVGEWDTFRESVVDAHYRQNPGWADVWRTDERWLSRRPMYAWSESEGALALTAVILRRTLPFPGKYHYDIRKGPLFGSLDVLEAWLAWALPRMETDAVRVRPAPARELAHGGDEVETVLERAGFTRRRVFGGWGTLIIDVTEPEDAVLQSFRRQARQAIRKCQKAGMEVTADDTPAGRGAFATLLDMMSEHTPGIEVLSEAALARAGKKWSSGGDGGTILLARLGSDVVAGALVVKQGARAYLVSLPSSRGVTKLPTSHLIVWEAIRWAKSLGCATFDLEGYSLVAREGDSLWGVNQFKRGFAPGVAPTTYVAVHEKIVRPRYLAALRMAERVREAEILRDIAGRR